MRKSVVSGLVISIIFLFLLWNHLSIDICVVCCCCCGGGVAL